MKAEWLRNADFRGVAVVDGRGRPDCLLQGRLGLEF